MRHILRYAGVLFVAGSAACSVVPTSPQSDADRRGPVYDGGVFIGGGMAVGPQDSTTTHTTAGSTSGGEIAAPPADATGRAGGVFIGGGS